MQAKVDTFLILLFNLMPIVGVLYYEWIPFDMFWLFWVETLLLSFFNAIKIAFSQGHAAHEPFVEGLQQTHVGKAFRYMLARIGMFVFYSIFIIVFIGFMGTAGEDRVNMVQTMHFQNKLFNLALVIAFMSQAYYLIRFFFLNRAYYYAPVYGYSAIFDGRQLVIHVAIVIGAMGTSSFINEDVKQNYGAIWMMSILCIAKCVYELMTQKKEQPATV